MAANDLVLAITGASGSPYALRLLDVLIGAGRTIHLLVSPAGAEILLEEQGLRINLGGFDLAQLLGEKASQAKSGQVTYHDYRDFRAGIASGSYLTGGMVVCPCSSGTAAAIAHGLSQNLIHRAADVHLKERRKLILVPRETPLSIVQLRNLTLCAEAGAVVLPASPAFYTKPRTLDDAVNFIVGRICDQLGIDHSLLARWGQD
jgi:4-hydroxy-3-polyprenylbenzoate decarboxylase